jgi:hypothetical protein
VGAGRWDGAAVSGAAGACASALFSLALAVLGAGASSGAVGALLFSGAVGALLFSGAVGTLLFSVWAWARAVELLRRVVAGLLSASWLAAFVADFFSGSWLAAVAFSVFERLDRLRVVAGFTCSFVSEDSDVFVMKKTPFCISGTLRCLFFSSLAHLL